MTAPSRSKQSAVARLAAVSAAALLLGLGVAPGQAADAPAAAQTVRLGAGEHADHSRVVLNMTPPPGWSTRSVPGGVEIVLPGRAATFDDKAVTAQRRAHRVAGVTSRTERGATVLRLDFTCGCSAQAFSLRNSMIVVDVRDGAPEAMMATARTAETRDAAGAAHATTPAGQDGDHGAEAHENAGHDVPTHTEAAPAPVDITAKPEQAPGDEMRAEVARAREMLLRQLQRAADEGFVRFRDEPGAAPEMHTGDNPAAPREAAGSALEENRAAGHAAAPKPAAIEHADGHASATRGEKDEHAPAPTAHESHATPAHADPDHGDGAQVAAAPTRADHAGDHNGPAHTSMGHAAPDHAAPMEAVAAPPENEPDCPAETSLSPEYWIDERPFSEGLAAKRATLYDGLNRIDPEAAREMAAFYLGHGLGAEAALMTRAFESDDPTLAVLADAGRIIDGMPLPKESPFNRRTPCSGKVALWQAAALSRTDPAAATKAFRASGRSIARTPEPLRRLLGERIALATARAGDSEAASAVLALLSRNLDEPTDGMRMANAELALQEGRIVAAQSEFAALLKGRGAYAVDAAIGLAETLEEPIYAARAEKLAETLDGIALQQRYGPDEERVVGALARLRSRYGDLRGALAAIDDVTGRRSGDPVATRFAALRMDLLEHEVDAVTAGHDLGPEGPKRLVAVTEAVRSAEVGPRTDAMRTKLARHLIDTHAPRVAALVADAAASERDDALAELFLEATEQTALLEKVGGGEADHASDSDASHAAPHGGDDHALRTGDLEIGAGAHGGEQSNAAAEADAARQSLRSTALSHYAEGAAAPDELKPHDENAADETDGSEVSTLKGLFDREEGKPPPAPTSADEGRELIDRIDAEINFFKEIAEDG